MKVLRLVLLFCIGVKTTVAGGHIGGHGFVFDDDFGYSGHFGVGGVGIGSSVALLHSGPGLYKAVAGPSFLVNTVHHVNKVHGGGALLAHSGLGGGYGFGYGGFGYGGFGHGGFGHGGYFGLGLKH